jgi:hypothetical protein
VPALLVTKLLTFRTVNESSSRYFLSGDPCTKRTETGGEFFFLKLCETSVGLLTSFFRKSGTVTTSPSFKGPLNNALLAPSARSAAQSMKPAAIAMPQSVSPSCARTSLLIGFGLSRNTT